MPTIVLFDDGRLDLGPLSAMRESFHQRIGHLTAVERMTLMSGRSPEVIRLGKDDVPGGDDLLLINGALVAGAGVLEIGMGSVVRSCEGRIAAARLSGAGAKDVSFDDASPADREMPQAWRLLERPWDVLGLLAERIAFDIALRAALGGFEHRAAHCGDGPVYAGKGCIIGPHVTFDTRSGPILIDDGATVEAGAVVQGPCAIGARSMVSPNSVLRASTSIGPDCKVGGEISNCAFQGCSNKVHDGFLGDSLVGEWVNLGAGTLNSNLLNTYGEVLMRLRGSAPMERTGRQFMGCIVGDHAKTAIGTRIMTGSVIGVGAMYAGSAPIRGAVADFSWCTDEGVRQYRIDKFLEVARAVMSRRKRNMTSEDEARLRELHAAAS